MLVFGILRLSLFVVSLEICLRMAYGFRHVILNKFKLSKVVLKSSQTNKDDLSSNNVQFRLVTLNLLAPCYKKIRISNSSEFESNYQEIYVERCKELCALLLQTNADIILLQEFWFASNELQRTFTEALCDDHDAKYVMNGLKRTSHWRIRDDGLAVFTKADKVLLEDIREIYFHDCGDRVAHLLSLAIKPSTESTEVARTTRAQQFLCINTHLLFPHNTYSTKIRVREVTKMLGYADSYRQRELWSKKWTVRNYPIS